MMLHPRYPVVRKAEGSFSDAYFEILKRHNLSFEDATEMLANGIAHGVDPLKKADSAKTAAESEMETVLDRVIKEFELTSGEIVSIIAERLASLAKYKIRDERHPKNPGKGGDEA